MGDFPCRPYYLGRDTVTFMTMKQIDWTEPTEPEAAALDLVVRPRSRVLLRRNKKWSDL
jgi:hypothetical protein